MSEAPGVGGDTGRRKEILDCAAKLFAAKGTATTSMLDIAQDVGIRKPSLYHFFSSKEDLVRAVLRPVVEEPVHELQRILEGPGDTRHRIREALGSLGLFFQEYPHRMQILVREQLDVHLSAEASEEAMRWKREYTALWRRLLREGAKQGELREVDDKLAAFAIIGAMNWLYAWFDEGGSLEGREIGYQYADFFLGGLSR
jgi:AcrR family transcriptional regulator